MTIPRPWTPIEYQRSVQQSNILAKPSATDARFKAGAIFALLAWCTICYSLTHSIQHYKPQTQTPSTVPRAIFQHCPIPFLLTLPLLLIEICYATASSFIWTINPLKYDSHPAWIYGFGTCPILLIIVVFNIRGYIEPNEDRVLIGRRIERGRTLDAELGLGQKPSWWKRANGDRRLTNEQRLRALTTEIGGGTATGRNIERAIELNEISGARAEREGENPFGDDAAMGQEEDGGAPQGLVWSRGNLPASMTRRRSCSPSGAKPQQVRSMLDI